MLEYGSYGDFTPVLAKHSKAFCLLTVLARLNAVSPVAADLVRAGI